MVEPHDLREGKGLMRIRATHLGDENLQAVCGRGQAESDVADAARFATLPLFSRCSFCVSIDKRVKAGEAPYSRYAAGASPQLVGSRA